MNKKINEIFKQSKRLFIDNNTKLVIMSDCHRGAGDNFDNFVKNKSIFKAVLKYYYAKGFFYIELGDGDEMWEVKDYKDIIEVHLDTFKQLKRFYDSNRLLMIYGNHDIAKKSSTIMEKYFYKYHNKVTNKDEDLLNGLVAYESLVLNYKDYNIFLIHGHQADFFNSVVWKISRFFVRILWLPIEYIGTKFIITAEKNYQVAKNVERKLEKWSVKNNMMLISGHTHRALFSKVGQSLYFNAGSCIYSNGITCLEIENGNITLVKWSFDYKEKNFILTKREVLDGNVPIINFFNKNNLIL